MASKKRRRPQQRPTTSTATTAAATPQKSAVVAKRDERPKGPVKAPWSRRNIGLTLAGAMVINAIAGFWIAKTSSISDPALLLKATIVPYLPIVAAAFVLLETPVRLFRQERRMAITEALMTGLFCAFAMNAISTIVVNFNTPSVTTTSSSSTSPSSSAAPSPTERARTTASSSASPGASAHSGSSATARPSSTATASSSPSATPTTSAPPTSSASPSASPKGSAPAKPSGSTVAQPVPTSLPGTGAPDGTAQSPSDENIGWAVGDVFAFAITVLIYPFGFKFMTGSKPRDAGAGGKRGAPAPKARPKR